MTKIKIIYCATLCENENILETIEEFKKIINIRNDIELLICYDRI